MASETEVFLRRVWRSMIPRTDETSWVERLASLPASDAPLGDLGPIVRRMLDTGATVHDVARFARMVGYETAFGICHRLDNPYASYDDVEDGGDQLTWGLFVVDESGKPTKPVVGLHESILSLDPSGREMRP